MKYNKEFKPKSLLEVWECKESVYNDIKDKSLNDRLMYFRNGLEEALGILKSKKRKNSDGSYTLIPEDK